MSKENDIQQANLAVSEFISDFLCFLIVKAASRRRALEQNLLVADLLLQSLGFKIVDAQQDGTIVAELLSALPEKPQYGVI